ncbi:MAG: YkgJ family cysteine cluster protein [Syntrophobacteraceae bacterium]|nr:YkgJ family cysteine cluster protein [Syntrophobacteraceae bacterium]
MLPSTRYVEPVERTLDSTFKFNCFKEISCFNKCCRHTDMLLTPYDILRMKKRLGLSSDEFLKKYTYVHIDENSSHPFAVLKMLDEQDGRCPFVTDEGCGIYEDRPANCRYYPVGKGIMMRESEKGPVPEEFFFFIREPNCAGYDQDKEWTIESWRKAQGVDIYDDMNREWAEIQLRRDNPGKPKLDKSKQPLIYMATYDLDRFRRFVFESGFLNMFDVDPEEIEKLKTDEIALMKFAFKYLKYILMLEETLKIKDEHLKKPDAAQAT